MGLSGDAQGDTQVGTSALFGAVAVQICPRYGRTFLQPAIQEPVDIQLRFVQDEQPLPRILVTLVRTLEALRPRRPPYL